MKKLFSILILCLGLFGTLTAQNIWKPIDIPGTLLGVSSDGSIFAYSDYFLYGEIIRSQDEGETWQVVLSSETEPDISFLYDMEHGFTISEDGRAFVIAEHQVEGYCLFYSDDNGDTWQQTTGIPFFLVSGMVEFGGIAAPTNDIIVGWSSGGDYIWTIDGGTTWNYTYFAPPHDGSYLPHELCDVIVNASGEIYASYLLYSQSEAAIARTNISHMSTWQGLNMLDCTVIWDMEFGSDGNAYMGYIRKATWSCGTVDYLQGDRYYVFAGQSIAVSENGVIYRLRYTDDLHAVLNYSLNQGECFYDFGEALAISQSSSDLFHDGNIYMGKDNQLYFHGNGQYWKSIPSASDIPSWSVGSEWYFFENQFNVYPNPTDGVLFIETHERASLLTQTYCITNLMGQTILEGNITAETQQIDVEALPKGMYFITVAGETQKFVIR